MSIITKKENKNVNFSKYHQDSIKNIIKFILNDHNDLNIHDQYALFLELSENILLKSEFLGYRQQVLNRLRKKFDQDNVKMDYHIAIKLPDTHLKILDALTEEFFYYHQRWKTETEKQFPNDYLLKMFSELMNQTSLLVSKFNLGTPVMVYLQQKIKYLEGKNKTISIKSFDDLNINKYNTDLSKQDPLNNGTGSPTTTETATRGSNEFPVRLSGTEQGQHLQPSSSESNNQGGLEGTQQGSNITETEEVF